jgi:TolB protein
MKHYFGKLFKVFIIVMITGCSAPVSITTEISPPQKLITTYVPIPTLTTLPNILNLKGKISFAYWNGKSDIFLMDLENSKYKNLTSSLSSSTEPSFSSNGKYIAFTSLQDFIPQVFIMKTDGSEITQLTFGKQSSYDPVWSPNGELILFLSERDGFLSSNRRVPVPEVYIMKSIGTEQKRVTDSQDMNESALAWSPKGDYIAASIGDPSISRHSREIYLFGLNGIIQKQLTEDGNNYGPNWSPNGEYITYYSINKSVCSGINIMQSDGSERFCLKIDKAIPPIQNRDPSWSPDGKYIIFSSNLDGDFDLYIVKTDGSGLTRLTDLPGDETSPGWIQ